ncbi:MAG: hypothetical protein HYZ68_07430 [Chloroflexi bacterium]|nr:hypothetical protein [Chloroflexota bacterium]
MATPRTALHPQGSTYIPQTHPRRAKGGPIPWRWQARTLRLALLALGLASLIGWFNLTQATQETTTVIRWHQLASQLEALRRENAQLRYEIAHAGELAVLRRRAGPQGFAPPQQTEYLFLPGYPQGSWGRQGLEATPTPAPEVGAWDRLLDSLRLLLTGES